MCTDRLLCSVGCAVCKNKTGVVSFATYTGLSSFHSRAGLCLCVIHCLHIRLLMYLSIKVSIVEMLSNVWINITFTFSLVAVNFHCLNDRHRTVDEDWIVRLFLGSHKFN